MSRINFTRFAPIRHTLWSGGFYAPPQNRGKIHLFPGGSLEIDVRGRMCLMSSHKKILLLSQYVSYKYSVSIVDHLNTIDGLHDEIGKKSPQIFTTKFFPFGGPQIMKKSCVKPNQKSRKKFFLLFSIFSTKKIYRNLRKNIRK